MAEYWENKHRDGTHWSLEIETDMWDYEQEGLVVSLWIENVDPDDNDKPSDALVMASPQQAREMADALRASADHIEEWHRENPLPRKHVP